MVKERYNVYRKGSNIHRSKKGFDTKRKAEWFAKKLEEQEGGKFEVCIEVYSEHY